ncbi:EAL domain-containing protein [Bordetella sp. FB-8]|uniref:EAL domain-containing protein n=1 Tax=Bordetella sp. FB-8 TaxID=1159870 RepID=UPI00036C5565|nr:EAL domain-containing protein [Bordetella sp. FB-8]
MFEVDAPLSLATEFERIVRDGQLQAHYQLIADLFHGSIHGYESLIRGPRNSPLHLPASLFGTARRLGRLVELELACAKAGLHGFVQSGAQGKLLLNLSINTVLACWYQWGADLPRQLLDDSGLPSDRLVIELTEQDAADDVHGLLQARFCLREHGIGLALDDYGAGSTNLQLWVRLQPDLVKIDRHFFYGISSSASGQQLIRALMSVAQALGTPLLAEGIETAADLATVRELGMRYVQGWHLGLVEPQPQVELPEPVLALLRLDRSRRVQAESGTVGTLLIEAMAVQPEHHTNDDIDKMFQDFPDLHSVAVLDREHRPIGLINRHTFSEKYAMRYTRDLFGRDPCATFMSHRPVMLDVGTPIDRLAPVLASEDQRYLRDGFIMTREGRYAGLGTGESLVRAVTELRLETARYANPLTALPGNIPIKRQMQQLMAGSECFIACYGDLNHFKSFNDMYGYWRGDAVIQLCAEVIKRYCDIQQDFIGHVGGDDFVMLMRSGDWQARLEDMVAQFNQRAIDLYDEHDRGLGGIELQDRYGVTRFFPFVTLGVAALVVQPQRCQGVEPQAVAAAVAELKRRVKSERASLLVDDYAALANAK